MFESTEKSIRSYLESRAKWLCLELERYWPKTGSYSFRLAGGAMAGKVSDVDLFPADTDPPKLCNTRELSNTRNAVTYDCRPWPVQCCKYQQPDLTALVLSFDFSHVQVGADISLKNGTISIEGVEFSEAFLTAKATGISEYTGSSYPLSSLIRAGKYFRRDVMSRGVYIRAVIGALTDVVCRGFADYEDFKDQLDAVDLGLLPEELSEVENSHLRELYSALERKVPCTP